MPHKLSQHRAQCRRVLHVAAGLLLIVLALPVSAHDFWLEPLKFRAKPGDTVPLRLLVGMDFKGNAALYNPEQFERYFFVDRTGEHPVPGIVGDDPAGTVAVTGPGLLMVGFLSKQFDVTFDDINEFEKYLAIEGLERNLELARKRARGRHKILELYTRCAKSLIASRDAHTDNADRILGFPLELVAESNPYRQNDLQLRLLYLGKPLEGALVTAFNKAAPLTKLRAHTDKDGRVTFTLTRPGVWLVASVHQVPMPWYTKADWESFWASLTFERP